MTVVLVGNTKSGRGRAAAAPPSLPRALERPASAATSLSAQRGSDAAPQHRFDPARFRGARAILACGGTAPSTPSTDAAIRTGTPSTTSPPATRTSSPAATRWTATRRHSSAPSPNTGSSAPTSGSPRAALPHHGDRRPRRQRHRTPPLRAHQSPGPPRLLRARAQRGGLALPPPHDHHRRRQDGCGRPPGLADHRQRPRVRRGSTSRHRAGPDSGTLTAVFLPATNLRDCVNWVLRAWTRRHARDPGWSPPRARTSASRAPTALRTPA
jgi:hypothetical protein